MSILIITTVIFSYFVIRSVLIVMGIYKRPILERFENYGTERVYSPLLGLIAWSLVFLVFLIVVMADLGLVSMNIGFFFFLVGLIFLMIMAYYEKILVLVHNNPEIFAKYPRWYYELLVNTSREERRRIAYLWLRLPSRTRLIYSTRDAYFQHWVDLVLMTIA